MPSSLVSTTAGRPVLPTAPGDVRRAGREHRPHRLPDGESRPPPGRRARMRPAPRRRRPSSPSSIAARCTAVAGTPNASASPSCTSESSAPWRISSNTRPRSSRCSASVARANSASTAAARSAAEPGPAEGGDPLECRVDVGDVSVRFGRRCGQRGQRCPAHPGPPLPQRPGQVRHHQGDLGGRPPAAGDGSLDRVGLAGWRRRSARVWSAGNGWRRRRRTSRQAWRTAPAHLDPSHRQTPPAELLTVGSFSCYLGRPRPTAWLRPAARA